MNPFQSFSLNAIVKIPHTIHFDDIGLSNDPFRIPYGNSQTGFSRGNLCGPHDSIFSGELHEPFSSMPHGARFDHIEPPMRFK